MRPIHYSLPVALALTALAPLAPAQTLKYPETPRENVVEQMFGTTVADPYRWLEDDHSAKTKEWVEAQNKVTFAYLAAIPEREKIKERITKLWNYEKFGIPGKEGGNYFYTYNTGLQPQAVLFVTGDLNDKGRALLDPKQYSEKGTASIAGTGITDDAKLMAYGISDAGSDWNKWYVRDVATGKDLPDKLDWIKFSGASWTKDNKGFFYSRFDAPEAGKTLTGSNFYQKVYYHRLGTTQDKDVLVYERQDEKDWGFQAGVTDDGRYLALTVSKGTDTRNRFFVRDLRAKPVGEVGKPWMNDAGKTFGTGYEELSVGDKTILAIESTVRGFEELPPSTKPDGNDKAAAEAKKSADEFRVKRKEAIAKQGNTSRGFVEILNNLDASYNFIDNDGPMFWFLCNVGAPRGKVIGIDITKPDRANWKEIIPEADATLVNVSAVGNQLIANYLRDAASEVKVFDLTGKLVRKVDLPGIGSAAGFGGKRSDTETFYQFTGFTMPPTVFRYDIASGKSSVFKQAKVDFNPGDYETKQVFYTSKDGTKIPMFITARTGVKLDGNNPTLLYGYGGFNQNITPSFSPSRLVWMEMGGIFAVATLRGGGEYGEEWHQAGMKLHKQNVFDDFIGAGEWLIAQKYTSSNRLAIWGASNGGLLVGACMTQRPDLFRAAIPAVGVMDMLRFHKFTIGAAWASDYGSAEKEDEFHTLFAYSPYHALLRMTSAPRFPSTLVTTADHDDRVVPGHSFKFAAALQAVGAPDGVVQMDRPLLIRIDTDAGHGGGKPTGKVIDEASDMWAFLVKNLGMTPRLN